MRNVLNKNGGEYQNTHIMLNNPATPPPQKNPSCGR